MLGFSHSLFSGEPGIGFWFPKLCGRREDVQTKLVLCPLGGRKEWMWDR